LQMLCLLSLLATPVALHSSRSGGETASLQASYGLGSGDRGPESLLPQAPFKSLEWCPRTCPAAAREEALLGSQPPKWSAPSGTPYANTGPTCNLCEHAWLFVVSVGGRTGSTTILNMLNAHPIIRLAGENHELPVVYQNWLNIADVASSHNVIDYPILFQGPDERGPMSPLDLACNVQNYMMQLSSPIRHLQPKPLTPIFGFKDITWNSTTVDFARMLFPCSRFIFNSNLNATASVASRSESFSPDHTEAHKKVLKESAASFEKFNRWINATIAQDKAEGKGWRNFFLPIEDFSVDTFNRLLLWLGETGCQYTGLIHANSDTNGKPGYNMTGAHWQDAAKLMTGRCDLAIVNTSSTGSGLGGGDSLSGSSSAA